LQFSAFEMLLQRSVGTNRFCVAQEALISACAFKQESAHLTVGVKGSDRFEATQLLCGIPIDGFENFDSA